MITRIWHGWTSSADADAYQQVLEQKSHPASPGATSPGCAAPACCAGTWPAARWSS